MGKKRPNTAMMREAEADLEAMRQRVRELEVLTDLLLTEIERLRTILRHPEMLK